MSLPRWPDGIRQGLNDLTSPELAAWVEVLAQEIEERARRRVMYLFGAGADERYARARLYQQAAEAVEADLVANLPSPPPRPRPAGRGIEIIARL